MSLSDHINPGDLRRPWACPRCGVYENPGPHDGHVCDERSVVRVQAKQQVSPADAAELDAWVNLPWKGPG